MQNKKEEIQIAIQSKMEQIGKLISEYENIGGKVVNATVLRYDDSDYHHMALNGTGEDIGELLFANEHLSNIIDGHQIFEIIGEFDMEEEE